VTDPKDLAELCKELRSECDRAENNCPPHDHPPRFKVPTLVMRQLLDAAERHPIICGEQRAHIADLEKRLAEAELRYGQGRVDGYKEALDDMRVVSENTVRAHMRIADLEQRLAEAEQRADFEGRASTVASDEADTLSGRVTELESLLVTQSELAANGTAVIKDVQDRACDLERQLAERARQVALLDAHLTRQAEVLAELIRQVQERCNELARELAERTQAFALAKQNIADLERQLAELRARSDSR
jgi:chromosome segregation ATPase